MSRRAKRRPGRPLRRGKPCMRSRTWITCGCGPRCRSRRMPEVKVGQDAALSFPSWRKNRASRVSFIYPHIDPASRRGAVRLELENPVRCCGRTCGRRLKSG
jgi:hypothetical protein